MLTGGVQFCGLRGDADLPAARAKDDSGKEDLRASFAEHPPQMTSVLPDPDGSKARQGHRSLNAILTDPNPRATGLRRLVSQTKRRNGGVFPLEAGEPDFLTTAFAGAGVGERSQGATAVDGALLEYLLGHFVPPCQSGYLDLGNAVLVHGNHSSGSFGLLPSVEGVDQAEPSPRHGMPRIGLTLTECGFHEVQGLVEREPRRTGMPRQRPLLLDGGVEAVSEGGVAAHRQRV